MANILLFSCLLGPLQAVLLHLAVYHHHPVQVVNNSTVLYNFIFKTPTTHPQDITVVHFIDVLLLIPENRKGQESRCLGKTLMLNWGDKSWGKSAYPAKFLGVKKKNIRFFFDYRWVKTKLGLEVALHDTLVSAVNVKALQPHAGY